jgi:hypothetical protein
MPKCNGCGKEIKGSLFYERKFKNKSYYSCSVPCRQTVELKIRKIRGNQKEDPTPDPVRHIKNKKKNYNSYQKVKITVIQLENIPTWPGIGDGK